MVSLHVDVAVALGAVVTLVAVVLCESVFRGPGGRKPEGLRGWEPGPRGLEPGL